MRVITIQVPENAEDGDTLTFIVDGQEMEISLPLGSNPGDELEIQVDSNERQDETDDLVTKVDLGGGIILELNSEIPMEGTSETCPNFADDGEGTDGTHALPWAAGFEVVRWLNAIDFKTKPIRVLELGSGLGLFGMAFAIKMLGEGGTMHLTDLPDAMPLLRYNIDRNLHFLPSGVSARTLQWQEDSIPSTEPPYDCIIGSDLLYNVQSIPALVGTVRRLLHPTKGTVILAVRWRKPELERTFFRDTGLEWSLLPSSLPCQLSWEEWGDPSLEASNLYFHQTMISINGKTKALVDITEHDSKQMSSLEFEAWEQAHVQVYIGSHPEYSIIDML